MKSYLENWGLFDDRQYKTLGRVTKKEIDAHIKLCMKFLRTHRDGLMAHSLTQDIITLVFFESASKKEIKEESKIFEDFGGYEQRLDSLKMATRDAVESFATHNSDFTNEDEIIRLHRKLNLKLRMIFDKENKAFLIDKIFNALALCDILFESLEDFLDERKCPPDYWYYNIHSLTALKGGLEVYQVFGLENYFINMKRALLCLLNYILLQISKSIALYSTEYDFDKYEKTLKQNSSQFIKKYIFSKSWTAFLKINGEDLLQFSGKEFAFKVSNSELNNWVSEHEVYRRSKWIHSALRFLEAIKNSNNSELFFVFLFKNERSIWETENKALCEPFFESLYAQSVKDDPSDVIYHPFNHALKAAKIIARKNGFYKTFKAESQPKSEKSRMEFLESITIEKITVLVENIKQMCKKFFDSKHRIYKQKDSEKNREAKKQQFKTFSQRLNMLRALICSYDWEYHDEAADNVLHEISILSIKINSDQNNPFTQHLIKQDL